ncbi:MAG: S41 family peptidase [Planctomycetota bacterium]|nr:S41 family peptidase [Planctomycetota bacterium]
MRIVPSNPLALVAGALALLLAAPASAQDLRQNVRAILAQSDDAAPSGVYALAEELADLAPERNLDGFLSAVMAEAGEPANSNRRLCAALALADLKEDATFGKSVFTLLEPVATSGADQVRAVALSLLARERLFNARVLPDVRDVALKACEDELVAPKVRIEAALALWSVGTNGQRGVAKTVLEQFLQSSDSELQQRGALALAEINTEGGRAWQILREIRNQPTDFGRRANLYIQREEQRREFDRALNDLLQKKGPEWRSAVGGDDDYKVLDELRHRIRIQHIHGSDITDEEMVEYAAKGMLQGLDRHSTYFTSQEFQKFYFDLNREYGGIGAFVNFDQDGDFSIVRPIYSGPAYEVGLRSGDKILEVDGWETGGHTTEEIIKKLKGRPDSEVVLKFFRPGFQEAQEIAVTRRQISVPAVNWTMVPGEIGYIELINFSANISQELQVALADLVGKGAKGIVLDVRNNTGGFLTQARDVVEQFVEGKQLVVYTEGPNEPRRSYSTSARRRREACGLPLAVLTNRLSASASEITAGALQDLGRATVIGKRSFGKGSVQNLFPLQTSPEEAFDDLNGDRTWQEGEPFTDRNGNEVYDPGAHIKLTVAKYYLPSGRCPHREYDKEGRIVDPDWGVKPDIELELLENKPEDAWKNSAVFAVLKTGAIREDVREEMQNNEALFRSLAEGDDGDPQKYPGFDAFYERLDTKLSEDDVRRWLRYEVRDQVSDLRGAVYPGNRALGDAQEDAQLQEAIRTLMLERGDDIREVAALKNVLKISFEQSEAGK